MNPENSVETLLRWLDPAPMYLEVFKYAELVAMSLTPVLFLIAIFIRITETQLSGLTQGPKWGEALKDIFLWGTVIGVYFTVFGLISAFMNTVYTWIDRFGSISSITDKFNEILAAIKTQRGGQEATENITDMLFGGATLPVQLLALMAYYLTLYAAAFITAFLKIAHAFAFGVAFVWGLIAIPMSISVNLKLLRGWGLLAAFVLAWPLVQGVMIALFAPVFTSASEHIVHGIQGLSYFKLLDIRLLFSVVHLLLIAILIAAPLVTVYLTANAPSGAAMVMPFVAAALGAAAVAFKINQPVPGSPKSPAGGGNHPTPGAPTLQSIPRRLSEADIAIGSAIPRAVIGRGQGEIKQREPRQANVERGRAPITGNATSASPGATQAASATTDSAPSTPASTSEAASVVTSKKKQARRGAILNQRKNAQVKPK